MAKFTVQMTCDNAAFEEPGPEVARILLELSRKVAGGFFDRDCGLLIDENGNEVGAWEWTGDAGE
jgi:hypothetical protein